MEEVQTTYYTIGIPDYFSIFCFHLFLLFAEYLSDARYCNSLGILYFACHSFIVGMGMRIDLPLK